MRKKTIFTLLFFECFLALALFLRVHFSSVENPKSSVVSQKLPMVAEKKSQDVSDKTVLQEYADEAEEYLEQQHAFTDERNVDRFADAKVIEFRDGNSDANGRYVRQRLIQADFKYPLILLEETMEPDIESGVSRIVRQTAMVADHVMVKVQSGLSEDDVAEAVSKYGGAIRKKMYAPDLYLVAFENVDLDSVSQAIEDFSAEPVVIAYAEPDYIVHALDTAPNDPDFSELWGLHNTGQSSGTPDADIDALEAWGVTTGSSNILVAVIDSGIDYDHEDLVANMWINPGEAGLLSTNGFDDDGNGLIDDYRGWDFHNDDNDSMDDNSHGTHCAGTIGAVGNNNVGVAGVCWDVSLVGIKFLGASGHGATSDAIDATLYAARLGVRLISASYGGGGSTDAGYESIETAGASNMLFIAAAGNFADDNDVVPHYPSSYTNDNLIAVASSTRDDELSSFSCYGLTSVDLAAPGSSVLSTIPGNGYGTKSGTSMATPHVAGAAALLWSYDPDMTAAEVKAALMDTVDTKEVFAGRMASGGRLNINKAIRSLNGLHYDKPEYFTEAWATLTLVDKLLAGSVTQNVQITTDDGDLESLILRESTPGGDVFTNRIWISKDAVTIPESGQIEALHGSVLTAMYANATAGITNVTTATINLELSVHITTSFTIFPFETNRTQISGANNGNVHVDMLVSNSTSGDAVGFSATNNWVAPEIPLLIGPNEIWVCGTNAHGFVDGDWVTLVRRGPSGITNYVSKNGSHEWPFLSWSTSSTNLQDALDASATGNLVLVSNGTYFINHEISVDHDVTLKGVNGFENTTIDGQQMDRCLNLEDHACLISGFTIQNGMTDNDGGGILCSSSAPIISNCIVVGNSAFGAGGMFRGTAYNCTFTGNSSKYAAGVGYSTLKNCTVKDNSAHYDGGGTYRGTVDNCVVSDNSAGDDGGGMYYSTAHNCTLTGNQAVDEGGGAYEGSLYNCIVYYNQAVDGSNWSKTDFAYSCTTPMPVGSGNVDDEPELTDGRHIAESSPCRGAGSSSHAIGTDIDGDEWLSPPSIGCDEYSGAHSGPLAVSVSSDYSNTCADASISLTASIEGAADASWWGFGDGTIISNRLSVNHAWSTPGIYAVVFSAANSENAASATVQVHVVEYSYHYVDASSTSPQSPYTNWAHAAQTIQDAVDTAFPGGTVVVTNGVYNSGGRVAPGNDLTNRVYVNRPLTIQSVNGPEATLIVGEGPVGSSAVRGAWLAEGAVLSGFTLTNGHTSTSGHYILERSGGGVWCESIDAVVTNCVISGCSAGNYGGGVYLGTLYNSVLSENTGTSGGGAYKSILRSCVLIGNSARNYGGGSYYSTNYNCTLTGNTAANRGGGIYSGKTYNSIIYNNQAPRDANWVYGTYGYCCTTPKPSGTGHITNSPALTDGRHIIEESPCTGAGSSSYASGRDIDGDFWHAPPSIGCDEYSGSRGGSLFVSLSASYSNTCVNSPISFVATVSGDANMNEWSFGDSSGVMNTIYAEHQWASPGIYDVVFMAFNADSSAIATVQVSVVNVSYHYVDASSASPQSPYTNWTQAAQTIQDAVDAALPGAGVVVTNGIYDSGGRSQTGATLKNRVCIEKPLTLQSVNGPQNTLIVGKGPVGSSAVRGVWLGAGSMLSGFTVTNGCTASSGDIYLEQSGGGIWCEGNNAVISNCVISKCSADNYAGGVYLGTLYSSEMVGNTATSSDGGGAYYSILRSCVLTGNRAARYGGGTYYCTVYNSTITGNEAGSSGGGIRSGKTYNSIIYNNQAPVDANWKYGAYGYCCTTPKPSGAGHITNSPVLTDDRHIAASSPCVGEGSSSYASGTDIDGDAWQSPPGMGCDEYTGLHSGPLAVSVSANYTNVSVGALVSFTAAVTGSADQNVWGFGDFASETNTLYTEHQWAASGNYDVVFTAINDDSWVSATVQVSVVNVSTHYVDTSSTSAQSPYTNWTHAAQTIQDAVDAALPGAVIMVTNGVYDSGGRAATGATHMNRVCVEKPLTIQSVNGSENTLIVGEGPVGSGAVRGVWLGAGSMLSGFTVTNGCTASLGDVYLEQSGAGVWCEGNNVVISNCVISGCSADNYAGGVYLGTLYNSTLSGNSADFNHGGAAYYGILYNCLLNDNEASDGGGAFYGELYNCLLTGNEASDDGGGTYYSKLYNCTVTGNTASDLADGTYRGSLYNTIVWPNEAYSPSDNSSWRNDPGFVDVAKGNFRLQSNSPCINSGNNTYSKETTDLDGNPRIVDDIVDIGAYERPKDEPPPSLPVPFSETFEDDGNNAGALGTLNSQHGWAAGEGAVVINTDAQRGSQALSITEATASHTFDGDPTNIWISFWCRSMIGGASPESVPSDASAVFYVNTNDQIVAYDSTSAMLITSSTVSNGWNNFAVFCDYVSKVWNLELNDKLVVSNFAFYGSVTGFNAIELREQSTNVLFIDSIKIADTPNETDFDGDGLPDWWEEQHYGDTSSGPGNSCSNGFNTVWQAYIAGLDPNDPNAAFLTSIFPGEILQWPCVSGRVYSVLWTTNLLDGFQPLETNIPWTQGSYTNPDALPFGFYKIDVELPE